MKVGHITSIEAMELVENLNFIIDRESLELMSSCVLNPFSLNCHGYFYRILWNDMEVYNSESSEHGWDEETNDYQYSVMDVIRQNMEKYREQLQQQTMMLLPEREN